MPTGKVKSYNPDRGYGFITPDGDGKEVYVSAKNVEGDAPLAPA